MGKHITSREYTPMISKWFAVGAALLAALVPPRAARANQIVLFSSEEGTITFTSPTSFSSGLQPIRGLDCYPQASGPACGDYALNAFMTAVPGTSSFAANIAVQEGVPIAQLEGSVDWTAVEGYPASPELIGTFTGSVQVLDPSSLIAAMFAADFPTGSIDPISVSLGADPQNPGGPCQPPCYVITGGDILPPAPVPAPPIGRNLPALLAVCIFLLGAKLLERDQHRRRLGGLT
jgi:hypothetical protein